MHTDSPSRDVGQAIRRTLWPIVLVMLPIPFLLACNFWRVMSESVWADFDDQRDTIGRVADDFSQEELATQSAATATALGNGLPQRGTLTGNCGDQGVIVWDQARCNAGFRYSYEVTVDFASRAFAVAYQADCGTSSQGLFAIDRSQSQVYLSLRDGSVLSDGRLFGMADQVSTTSSWVEGQEVPPLAPVATDNLMVLGFVDPGTPFLAMAMCTEDSVIGGADAVLASGWNEGFNPCAGGPGWAIACEVQTGR